MSKRLADGLSLFFIAAIAGLAIYLYPDLPDPMPSHWNASGEVDGTLPKPWGVWLLPLAAVFVLAVMKLIPVISPKGFRTDEFAGVLRLFQVLLVAFTAIVGALVLLAAMGSDVRMEVWIPIGVGLLFIVLGNYLGKVRKNFFLGIRTPWTLASDEVWARTHRLGGRVFVAGGLLLIAAAFVPAIANGLVVVILALAVIPVVYSYVLYRRIEGFTDEDGGGADGSA